VNCKRKSRRRFFLLMRSRTPPISSEFRGGGVWTPQTTPSGTPLHLRTHRYLKKRCCFVWSCRLRSLVLLRVVIRWKWVWGKGGKNWQREKKNLSPCSSPPQTSHGLASAKALVTKGEFTLYTLDVHRGWFIQSERCKSCFHPHLIQRDQWTK